MDFFEYIEFIGIIVIIIFSVIGAIINKIRKMIRNKQVNFDEFDDIEKIKEQELKEQEELEYESEVLKQVYHDSYINALNESYTNRRQYGFNNYSDEIDNTDRFKAHLEAQLNVEKAKKDLYNLKLLSDVEIEEDDVKEGIPINALRENGYNFEVKLFKKWARQIFGCIKIGTEEQLEVVKNFMTEELYGKLKKQMNEFARDGLDFITEDLIVEKCYLYDYAKSMSKEEIKILIDATMKEYIVEKSTNKIIRGNDRNSYNKKIIMTFLKEDIKTEEGFIHNCPNCGAEVIQTEFGNCRYCNTLVLPIRYNWTLTKFETM